MNKKRTPKRSKAAASSSSKRELPKSIADLVGSVHGLPADLSERLDDYLREGYGRKKVRE